jgi:DNA invertase Pin-like site-specific DNA recombinase
MGNVFVERLWQSLKYEYIDQKGYADGPETKVGIASWAHSTTARGRTRPRDIRRRWQSGAPRDLGLGEVAITITPLGGAMARESTHKQSFGARSDAESRHPLGYARVLRGDCQMNAMQIKALSMAGCTRIIEEVTSSGRWDRPELDRLLGHLRSGDTVVVWKLDRLSPSLKDVLHIMVRIAAAGAGFRSIIERIDTTTPAGRMMMRMVGKFAEFERTIVNERIVAGLAAARAEGRVLGRPRKLSAAKEREIAESVLSGGKSASAMARLHDIDKGTVSRIVAEYRTRPSNEGGVTLRTGLPPENGKRRL